MRSFIIGLIFIVCAASFGDANGTGGIISENGAYIPGNFTSKYLKLIVFIELNV